MGQDDNDDVEQLLDAVRRDAVRTDPGHPFYEFSDAHNNSTVNLCESPDDDNIQKLVNIITIYTLEHRTCTYTQGMTDMLSPILYVMKHEADAYVCFAAMVERIRHHFETWCVGTLLKLERLRHLCEVLDPELFHHLMENIEEDAFALFFGMVLIECRREFSFEDSFHLLEAIWAAVACMKDSLPRTTTLTHTEWAHYMTQLSPDVLQQVMGETGSPYSAVPLPISESMDTQTRSRQASMLSQGSMLQHDQFRSSVAGANLSISHMVSQTEVIIEEGERSNGETGSLAEVSVSEVPVEKRPRSFTDPSIKSSNPSLEQAEHAVKGKVGLSDSHSESEIIDSYTSGPPPSKQKSSSSSRAVTEMSDMSSLSSTNNLANSYKSVDSKNATRNGMGSATSDGSHSPAGKVVMNGHHSSSSLEEIDDGGASPPNFEINSEGVMLGLNLQKDEKKGSASSDASTLKSMDSPVKQPPASAVENDILPQCSGPSDLSSNCRSALNALPNVNQSEGVSPSPSHPCSSAVYQTANDDSSATELPSRSVSLTPSPPPQDQPTTLAASMNGDICDPRLEEEGEATPVHRVHIRPTLANGAIIQGKGMGEHHGGGESLLPTGNDPSVSAALVAEDVHKISDRERSSEQQHTKPTRIRGSSRHRAKPQPQRSSPLDVYDTETCSASSRVTPVTFFDAMEQLASSAPGSGPNFMQSGQLQHSLVHSGEQDEENELELSQANSMIFSQLMSMDRSAPLVSREKSLDIPVSDCFPLFVCLSILVQHRDEIMQRNIDFVGLSVLLNAQAGTQDIDVTLDVARDLYKTYREYQMTFLNDNPEDLDTWLDDDRAISTDDSEGQWDPDDNDHEERTSIASDNVFTH